MSEKTGIKLNVQANAEDQTVGPVIDDEENTIADKFGPLLTAPQRPCCHKCDYFNYEPQELEIVIALNQSICLDIKGFCIFNPKWEPVISDTLHRCSQYEPTGEE